MASDIDYANPGMYRILQAVPMLQWRLCPRCEYIGLYRDNMLPICRCHACGSPATRAMQSANAILHRTPLAIRAADRGQVICENDCRTTGEKLRDAQCERDEARAIVRWLYTRLTDPTAREKAQDKWPWLKESP